MKNFLSEEEIKLLEQKHRHCKEKRQADRIKTILSLNMGYEYKEIAKLLLLDDSTLRNYYVEFAEGGMEKLLSDDYTGGTSRLSCEQLQQLDKHLQENTYSSSKDIKAYIEKTFGVSYTCEGVKKILKRLNFTYKKPKHIPGKADREKQQAFLNQLEELQTSKAPEDKIYYMDGCHPKHNSIAAYGCLPAAGRDKERERKTT